MGGRLWGGVRVGRRGVGGDGSVGVEGTVRVTRWTLSPRYPNLR